MALIKTIEEVKKYLPVAYSANIGIMPAVDAVEERYLLAILGNDLYQVLQANYDAATLTPSQQLLVNRCQAVIVPFAFADNLPFLQTTLTNNGLQRMEATDTRGAFRWEYNNVITKLENTGYSAQEALILFLKNYSADFPQWSASPYNNPEGFTIIRDGSELSQLLGLQQPHRSYLLLQSTFLSIRDLYLDEVLGDAFYAALSIRIVADQLTTEDKALLKILRPACARLAMKHAARELSINFGNGGFTVVDAATMKDNPEEGKADPGAGRLNNFAMEMERSGLTLLEKARQFLNANASETIFPEYFTSSLYQAPDAEIRMPYNNDEFKGFFVA